MTFDNLPSHKYDSLFYTYVCTDFLSYLQGVISL